jgi:serine/threonine-protein kinase RsbW
MHRRILIVDDHDNLASSLSEVFTHTDHSVDVVEDRQTALNISDIERYDLVITDLDIEYHADTDPSDVPVCLPRQVIDVAEGQEIKAFKICAANFRREPLDEEELKHLVATILDYKIRYVDLVENVADLLENIEFELPSTVSLMHIVLDYLMKRVEKLGVIKPEESNLFVALDEAFVNAVKHGNKFDSNKLVRINATVSKEEAKFTVEDEGEGFDVKSIPDPLDPQNLFKTSGRGVLFIYNIMDEVSYNDRGNRLTMVKRNDRSAKSET